MACPKVHCSSIPIDVWNESEGAEYVSSDTYPLVDHPYDDHTLS